MKDSSYKRGMIVTLLGGTIMTGISSYFTYQYSDHLKTFYCLVNTPYVQLNDPDLDKRNGSYVQVRGELDTFESIVSPITKTPVLGYTTTRLQKIASLKKQTFRKSRASRKKEKKDSFFSSTATEGEIGSDTKQDHWEVVWEEVENVVRYANNIFIRPVGRLPGSPMHGQVAPSENINILINSIDKANYLEQIKSYNQFSEAEDRTADRNSSRKLMGSKIIEKILPLNTRVTIFAQLNVTEDGHVSFGPPKDSFKYARRLNRTGVHNEWKNSLELTVRKPFIVTTMSQEEVYEAAYKDSLFWKWCAIGTGTVAVLFYGAALFIHSEKHEPAQSNLIDAISHYIPSYIYNNKN